MAHNILVLLLQIMMMMVMMMVKTWGLYLEGERKHVCDFSGKSSGRELHFSLE